MPLEPVLGIGVRRRLRDDALVLFSRPGHRDGEQRLGIDDARLAHEGVGRLEGSTDGHGLTGFRHFEEASARSELLDLPANAKGRFNGSGRGTSRLVVDAALNLQSKALESNLDV